MKQLASFLAAFAVLSVPAAALAAPARLSGTLVPARFCEGVRFDSQLYGPFIEANALDKITAAELQDPVVREQFRRAKAEKWSGQVRAGQKAKCGKASF